MTFLLPCRPCRTRVADTLGVSEESACLASLKGSDTTRSVLLGIGPRGQNLVGATHRHRLSTPPAAHKLESTDSTVLVVVQLGRSTPQLIAAEVAAPFHATHENPVSLAKSVRLERQTSRLVSDLEVA